ncbi:DUF1295 domain protein [Aspergillus foveolatus]|uniref:DUF1295 domain protein n=1 Tax=Aspergillus foveolatus TaxID=210207 RepID=UPI003CCDD6D3
MAEQEVYGGRLSTGPLPVDKAGSYLPHTSGAEQDLYGSRFGSSFDKARQHIPHVGQARGTAAEQDLYGSHFSGHTQSSTAAALGLLQSAALPSFTFHAAFSTIAYGISRYTDRAEGKDWLWPAGMTLNAWYSAIGTKVIHDGLSCSTAWSTLSYSEKLLLGGVTAWGVRLFHRIATRGVARGKDDPRYDTLKKDPGFWNKSLFTMFLPEAAVQTLISLPFVLPFRKTAESIASSPVTKERGWYHALAVFLFSAGFAMEVLADKRLASHKKKGDIGVCRDGVWSVVRHPNYLGDALIHLSFPVLLLGAGLFHPLAALGPITNYVFLRFVGGDRENEQTQAERYAKEDPIKAQQFAEYRSEKNSFWPSIKELSNKWTWAVALAGAGGVVLERGLRSAFA